MYIPLSSYKFPKMKNNYSQQKKDESSLSGSHLETRSKAGADDTREYACGCGNHADIIFVLEILDE